MTDYANRYAPDQVDWFRVTTFDQTSWPLADSATHLSTTNKALSKFANVSWARIRGVYAQTSTVESVGGDDYLQGLTATGGSPILKLPISDIDEWGPDLDIYWEEGFSVQIVEGTGGSGVCNYIIQFEYQNQWVS